MHFRIVILCSGSKFTRSRTFFNLNKRGDMSFKQNLILFIYLYTLNFSHHIMLVKAMLCIVSRCFFMS